MSRYDVDWDEMEDLRVVAPFFDQVRAQFAEGPAPAIGTELATLFVFGAPPVGVVAPPKPAPSRSRVARRVAAGAIGGLALVGGMGAAGALPAPIQEPVAMAARHVGLNLPRPHHHHQRETPASTTRGGTDSTPASTSRTHKSTHVPSTDPTLSTGGSTATSGADTQQSGTVTNKSGSGTTATTGNSTVTSHSGSAVSSTSSDKSGGPNDTGGKHPTYHGNGRTTRDRSGSTSTTSPPTTDGTGSGDGGGSPSTTPTTAAP